MQKKTIEIDKNKLSFYEDMFSWDSDDMEKHDVVKLSTLKTFTAKFDDGCEADIKINSSEDDIWSEGVLFDSNGCEIVHTDVCDSLEGDWDFGIGDETKYGVSIIGK